MEKAVIMPEDGVELSDEQRRKRRSRSIAIAWVLAGLVAVLWVVTIVKLGPGAAVEPF